MNILVSRRTEFDTQQKAFVFVIELEGGKHYRVVAITSDDHIYSTTCNSDSWRSLRDESGLTSSGEFVEELASKSVNLDVEPGDDVVKVKWLREDEDGLTFEFCCLSLSSEEKTGIFEIVDIICKERGEYLTQATNATAEVKIMEEKFMKVEKNVKEMSEYCRNLEMTMISKFVAILNEEKKA